MRTLALVLLIGVLIGQFAVAHADERASAAAAASVSVRPKSVTPGSTSAADIGKRAASPLVFPPYRARLTAAHAAHAKQPQLTCEACHVSAKTSQKADDWLGPDPALCTTCHGRQYEGVVMVRTAAPRLRFSHAKHSLQRIPCDRCHQGTSSRVDAAGHERLPLMGDCLKCHDSDRRAPNTRGGNCRLCHVASNGVIRTRFREGLLVPGDSLPAMRHSAGWLWQHGEAAMTSHSVCVSCHREAECVGCHNGRLRPRMVHPNDWQALHGIEARQAGAQCNTCHRSQSECLTCHLRAGVSPGGPTAARLNVGRFHLPASVWTDRPRTARHHANQARLHMDECVSCHQERDCATCHATAGVGGPGTNSSVGAGISPHPMQFRNTCGGVLAKNPRACWGCHRPEDPNLLPCR